MLAKQIGIVNCVGTKHRPRRHFITLFINLSDKPVREARGERLPDSVPPRVT
jgi:hypothetical protein